MLIQIIETDKQYLKGFVPFLVDMGAKPTNQENVFEVRDDFDLTAYHGIEKYDPDKEAAIQAEIEWIKNYSGTFPFYLSLKDQYARKGYLSDKQWASVTKAVQRDAQYKVQKELKASLPKSFSLPVGAIVVLKKFFAKDTAAMAGCVRPYYAFEVTDVQAETERAYKLTLKLTAQKTTHCGVCGAFLSNPESVANGIGPICGEKWGVGNSLESLSEKLGTTAQVTRWLPKTAIKERFEVIPNGTK